MTFYFIKILKKIHRHAMQKIGSGFWSYSNESLNLSKDKILIDLSSDRANHFGDQLFFIAAFKNKNIKRFIFLTNKKYLMLWETFGIENVTDSISDLNYQDYVYVSTYENAYLNKKFSKKFNKKIFFDFTDTSIVKPLYKHIEKKFKLENLNGSEFSIVPSDSPYAKEKYFIFNDIIYSRGFLRKKLSLMLKTFIDREIGYKNNIYFVGSASDKEFINYNDNLIDLRGKITFDELTNLLIHKNCLGYIGLDNGLMHLSLLLKVKCRILFRGKIFRNQTDLHYRSINVAMNKDAKNNIEYIGNK